MLAEKCSIAYRSESIKYCFIVSKLEGIVHCSIVCKYGSIEDRSAAYRLGGTDDCFALLGSHGTEDCAIESTCGGSMYDSAVEKSDGPKDDWSVFIMKRKADCSNLLEFQGSGACETMPT